GPRRPFDHLLEAAARDHFGVNVDAVLDEDTEDALVLAVARQAPADAVRLDDPQRQRLALPDRFRPQAAHQHDGEHVTVLRDPLDKLLSRGFEAREFFNVIVLGHRCRLGLVPTGRGGILVNVVPQGATRGWPSLPSSCWFAEEESQSQRERRWLLLADG